MRHQISSLIAAQSGNDEADWYAEAEDYSLSDGQFPSQRPVMSVMNRLARTPTATKISAAAPANSAGVDARSFIAHGHQPALGDTNETPHCSAS